MPTVMINGKKHTPSSGTIKKMKARAAAEAAAKKAMPKAKVATPKAAMKAFGLMALTSAIQTR